MNTIEFLRFCAFLIIAGTIFRVIELRFPDSSIGRALGVIY